MQALLIPSHADESCQYPISVSGDGKFKLLVIATGSAPTQVTFLADSATAAILPLKGSKNTHLLLQSTEAATPEKFLPFFLMILRPPRSTRKESSAASDVYKRQGVSTI